MILFQIYWATTKYIIELSFPVSFFLKKMCLSSREFNDICGLHYISIGQHTLDPENLTITSYCFGDRNLKAIMR